MDMVYERVTCNGCGAEVPFGSFCSQCGEKLYVEHGRENVHTTFCANCGSMTPDAKFCTKCGYQKNYQRYF